MNTNYNSLEDSGWSALQPLLDAHLPAHFPLPKPPIIEKQPIQIIEKQGKEASLAEIWVGGGCICLVLIVGWLLFQDRLMDTTAMLMAQKHQKRLQLLKVNHLTSSDSIFKLRHQKLLLDYLKPSKKQNAPIERPYPIEIDVNVSDKRMNY